MIKKWWNNKVSVTYILTRVICMIKVCLFVSGSMCQHSLCVVFIVLLFWIRHQTIRPGQSKISSLGLIIASPVDNFIARSHGGLVCSYKSNRVKNYLTYKIKFYCWCRFLYLGGSPMASIWVTSVSCLHMCWYLSSLGLLDGDIVVGRRSFWRFARVWLLCGAAETIFLSHSVV